MPLVRTSIASDSIHINRTEQSLHIHISDVFKLLSKVMVREKSWSHRGKYILALVFTSILLSSVGVLAHNASAIHDADPISSVKHESKVKHVDTQAKSKNKAMHLRSPPHIPSSILEQFIQSKICKNKCVIPKSTD